MEGVTKAVATPAMLALAAAGLWTYLAFRADMQAA
jgi:hypothetical protein